MKSSFNYSKLLKVAMLAAALATIGCSKGMNTNAGKSNVASQDGTQTDLTIPGIGGPDKEITQSKQDGNHPTLQGEKPTPNAKPDPANLAKKGELDIPKSIQDQLAASAPGEDPIAPMRCYRATPQTMSVANSIELCEGASSTAPADCYMKTGTLSLSDSIKLCKQALVAAAPVSCYLSTGSLDLANSIRLCAAAPDSTSPMACYRKSPYTMDPVDSTTLCVQASSETGPVDCYLATGTLDTKNSVKLCSSALRKNVIASTGGSGSTNRTFALPQLAFGGGWYTAMYFTNTNTTPVSFQVNFVGDNGASLYVNLEGIGSVTTRAVNLNPGATVILEAPNTGSLVQGWVETTLPAGVDGYAIFRQSAAGRGDQEALVSLADVTSKSAEIIFDDTNFVTSVGLLNPSSGNVVVNVKALDSNGTSIGTSQITLSPRSKKALALRDISGLSGVAGRRGRASFTVTSGAVSVVALRFGGEAFSTIPVTQK